MNDENKKQLTQFLLHEWQQDYYAILLMNREVYFACDHQCFVLSSSDGQTTDTLPVPDLTSSHEEGDTLLILHGIYSDHNRVTPNSDIIIRSPDTDFFLLMVSFWEHFTLPLFFYTGMGNKRRLIHIRGLCERMENHIQNSLLGLHALTGSDVTSVFVQKGKVKPLNIPQKYPEYAASFKELGTSENVSLELNAKLEQFVCHTPTLTGFVIILFGLNTCTWQKVKHCCRAWMDLTKACYHPAEKL